MPIRGRISQRNRRGTNRSRYRKSNNQHKKVEVPTGSNKSPRNN